MNTVTACAIGDLDRTSPRCQTVKAVREGLEAVIRHSVPLAQLDGVVTARADLSGDILGRDARARVRGRLDLVFTMTAGAGRSVLVAILKRNAVNALVEGLGDIPVALGAGLYDVPPVHTGSDIDRLLHIVRAVAVAAGSRICVAGGERDAVNAVLVAGDEAGGRAHPLTHFGIVKVTAQAHPCLPRLVDF